MTTMTLPEVHGHIAPGFEHVRDVFADNWRQYDEIGAGFALRINGERVIDIHAGWADRKKTTQ